MKQLFELLNEKPSVTDKRKKLYFFWKICKYVKKFLQIKLFKINFKIADSPELEVNELYEVEFKDVGFTYLKQGNSAELTPVIHGISSKLKQEKQLQWSVTQKVVKLQSIVCYINFIILKLVVLL